MPQHDHSSRRVTWDEFREFRKEIHDDLGKLRTDFQHAMQELLAQIGSLHRPNYTLIVSVVSILLIITGMAGALVNSIISNEKSSRLNADEAVRTVMAYRFDATLEQVRQNKMHANRMHNEFEKRIGDFDQTIQREIKALDTILQREITLEVKRLDEKIDALQELRKAELAQREAKQ